MTPIISASELLQLYPLDELVLIDVSNGKEARSNYDAKHLDGALFVDLNSQLADIKDNVAEGGRHPLPSVTAFAKTLSELGITPKSHVVVYDDKNGSNAAARFWWMLKAVGHEKVQVLDGGFQAAEKVHFPINALLPAVTPSALYPISDWQLPRATMDEVERAAHDTTHLVVDVRDAARYRGETEPIDTVAGHIPGAINIPFTENLDANGLFLPSEVLKENYQKAFGTTPSENIIFHCGSGVTACHSLLAIAQAGMKIPKLYVGSWSEWSRNNKAIATK
ncbi:sulfurtransferase [Flavobacterium sp. GCM10023249]|uniref:sulfurtransferase n=1 Tax=unclassified Flavobacterium TaxID=196869 RepID=UPI00361CB03E